MARSTPAVIFDEASEAQSPSAADIARGPHVRWWFYLLALSPFLLPLYLIARYGVNLIWNDEWDFADLLLSAHRGALTWGQFWKLHNEHRLPVPYSFMYVLARLTDWNLRAEMILGAFMALLTSISLNLLIRATHPAEPEPLAAAKEPIVPRWVWQWLIVSCLCFSTVQYENWIYGFGCVNFFPMACITAAMALLCRRGANWVTIIGAGLLIEAATLSLANGMLGWFLVLPLLFLANSWDELRQRRAMILTWLVMMSIGIGTYFIGYERNPLAKNYYDAGILVRVQYFLVFLGQPLSYGVVSPIGVAQVVGFFIVCLYIACVIYMIRQALRGQMDLARRMVPWLCLGAYSVCSGILGASGRAGLGAQQATTSRYTSISIYLLIGLICTIPMVFRDLAERGRLESLTRRSDMILSALGTALAVGLLLSTIWSFSAASQWMREKEMGQAHLSFIRYFEEPNRMALVGDRKDLRETALALNAIGYLHPPILDDDDLRSLTVKSSDANARKYGVIEGARQLPDGTVNIWGWAAIPNPMRPANAVIIAYMSADGAPHACGIADVLGTRPDIAKTNGGDLLYTGWSTIFQSSRLPPGQHNVKCFAYDSEQQQAYELTFNSGAAPATAMKRAP